MLSIIKNHTLFTGLAFFSMLFGAGNLIYPLMVGSSSGNLLPIGLAGFFTTALFLPLIGLLSMTLFDGNYTDFFYRLGKIPGALLIFICMMIIGPFLAIPRIVTLSHMMMAPFIPWNTLQSINPFSSLLFSFILLGITFLTTFRENRIVTILGYLISPLLLISLTIIIIKGFINADSTYPQVSAHAIDIFKENFMRGYETLDLLGALFFSSIVLHILKNITGGIAGYDKKQLILISLKAGIIGISLLGLIYIGMSLLSVLHAHHFIYSNAGDFFRKLTFHVVGPHGAFIIGTAVIMACLSTAMALSAIVAEYVQHTLLHNSISYSAALFLVLLASIPLSTFGLDYFLQLTCGPITYIGYPVLIALTLCNFLYKLFGFKPVILPVFLTLAIATISYFL